jgi:hypothetical protein
MAQDRPPIDDILRTVRAYIDEIVPKLEGEARYHGQVSSYLLDMAERELLLGKDFDAKEQASLSRFMGRDGTLPELTEALSAGIRRGDYDNRWDELLAILLEGVVDKVRIVKPNHLDPMHRSAEAAAAAR